jgi:hypothetical protein
MLTRSIPTGNAIPAPRLQESPEQESAPTARGVTQRHVPEHHAAPPALEG